MPNLRLSLTDSLCARAKPEPREYALRDLRQPGLALRVQPCGARSWIMRARVNGKPVRHSLGAFPAIPVKDARQIAAALLSADAAPPPTLSTAPLFEIFQTEHERRWAALYKAAGLKTYQTYVRCELLPAFGGKRLDTITRPDVMRWFEGYSARRPGGANRALGILGQMLGAAKAWGHLPDGWLNPVTGVRMNRRKVVGTFLSERQMGRLGVVLDARMATGCTAAALLRFLTLTGCRVGEAVDLEWRDVLPDRLRLRDSKTGPRDVPLGVPVRRFLKSHRARSPSRAPSAPVFPLARRQHTETVRAAWLSIRREAGLPSALRIHDLRHSFASHAVMSGETLFSTSRLLGHRRVQMTARYAHLADAALLAAAEKIGAWIWASHHAHPRNTYQHLQERHENGPLSVPSVR
ncbi:site-specific integrase [Sphingopyxis panaciterrulae]|uniref:Integrase n=1 Tax=Sphingopyxis panaciterrulae TaxID=462372 RepID=A0A7W9B7D5_9SPHN|nr:site-specific integrase [Sphingopyxis panaciterrulae]MBB5707347.1 integrase [Sphingopyxis panaciterrulae]